MVLLTQRVLVGSREIKTVGNDLGYQSMNTEALTQISQWADSQIGHYAMTGYILKEVRERGSDTLVITLAEYHQNESIAEVLVSVEGNIYQSQFTILPGKEGPSPQQSTMTTDDKDVLIDWLSTGNSREASPNEA